MTEGFFVRCPRSFLAWLIGIVVLAVIGQYAPDLVPGRHGRAPWGPWPRPERPIGEPIIGRAHIVDGDTLDVDGERVRLFGIDAPERRQFCEDADGRRYACGRAAARALAALTAGRTLTCTPLDRRYDRDVARCMIEDRDISDAMVRAGQAIEFARYSRGAYASAEREARAAKRGIWAGRFEDPGEWRRRHRP